MNVHEKDDVQALGAPVRRVPECGRASGSPGTSVGTGRSRSSGGALAGWLAAALRPATASRGWGCPAEPRDPRPSARTHTGEVSR